MQGIVLTGGAISGRKGVMICATIALLFQRGSWTISKQLSTYGVSFSILVRTVEDDKAVGSLRATAEMRER